MLESPRIMSSVGIVYSNLYVKLHRASRADDPERYEWVESLMDALEREFPAEVQAERDNWDLPVVVYSER